VLRKVEGKFANGAVTAAMAYAFNQMQKGDVELGLSDRNEDGGYGSLKDASKAQHLAYDSEYQATSSREELDGYVGSMRIDGSKRYFFSEMIKTTTSFDFGIAHPSGVNVEMITHTHPPSTGLNQEGFSRGDSGLVGTTRSPGIPMNVRTPSGDLRYLTPEISRGIRFQTGNSFCSSSPCLPPHKKY